MHMHGYSSVAQTLGTRSCSLQNRGLVRDILKKSAFFIFDQQLRGIAFKVVLLEGVVSELAAPLIFEHRPPTRDILKIRFLLTS